MDKEEIILLVDDEPTIRKVLRTYLSGEGYECHEAGNADEAMSKIESKPAALVMLDIKMPGTSGLDLLPKIKARYPDTAIIMLTGVNDTQTAISCMRAGAYDYLIKPFNLEEVGFSAHRALEKRRLALENWEHQATIERQLNALNNLFQTHLTVRQQTEDIYCHLIDEMSKLSDNLHSLIAKAGTQMAKLKESPAERGHIMKSQDETAA